jgi:hypothetical protein
MDKLPKTKDEIEQLVIADLQTFVHCERAARVLVIPIADFKNPATWTVSRFDAGSSDGEACDRALQHIVPRFQRIYDLVQKH